MDLGIVGLPGLRSVAEALESDRLTGSLNAMRLRGIAPLDAPGAEALAAFSATTGITGPPLAAVLRAVIAERLRCQDSADRMELAWTGPEEQGSESRDTATVVRDLFRRAKTDILIASYALDPNEKKSDALFGELARRYDEEPGLRIRFYVNVHRPYRNGELVDTPSAELLSAFARRFRQEVWSGTRLPAVYYDPRALSQEAGPRACLHAKCVVADDRWSLVTSANFTEAAHARNIEAGVLVDDPAFARRVRKQFEVLVENDALMCVSGLVKRQAGAHSICIQTQGELK